MYEINMDRINSQSNYLLHCLEVVTKIEKPIGLVEEFAIMRSFHIGVECIIDIGNTLIDGFIMRDPGGYSDIIDILEDEQVIPVEMTAKLKKFVKFREKLVRDYDQIRKDDLLIFIQGATIFQDFKTAVDLFLAKERQNGNIYV